MREPPRKQTARQRHEAWTLEHYRRIPRDLAAVRSAHGDAAHMCDAVAEDILAEHTSRGRVNKHGRELASAVRRAGEAIWALREKLKEPDDAR